MATKGKPATQDFQFVAGNLALDFVNTVGNRLSERREYFVEATDVARWARLAGIVGQSEVLSIKAAQLESLKAAREHLYALFHKIQSGQAPSNSDLGQINDMLAEVLPRRQLKARSGQVIWEWLGAQTNLAQVLGPVLSSAAELLVSGTCQSLRRCEDAECGWFFIDRSQAHRRRWCSMADCGNRAKARRFHSGAAKR